MQHSTELSCLLEPASKVGKLSQAFLCECKYMCVYVHTYSYIYIYIHTYFLCVSMNIRAYVRICTSLYTKVRASFCTICFKS